MWILAGIGVLNHAAQRLRFEYDPSAIAFFEIVRHVHSRAGCAARLGAKLHFRVRLIAIDRYTANIHVHRAHVERANRGQVLENSRADGVVVAHLLLAGAEAEQPGGQTQD